MCKVQFYGVILIDGCLVIKDNWLDWLFKIVGVNDVFIEVFMQ